MDEVKRCIEEIKYLLTDPYNNRYTHPRYFDMGLMDWTIEELLIRREQDSRAASSSSH